MKVLIASDKFKHALAAERACRALAEGVSAARTDATGVICPLGDGGEGTGEILAEATGADERSLRVADPLGRPRWARWWLAERSRRAIVELAEAAGLGLLDPNERDPLQTTTYGVGQMLLAAAGVSDEITLCVGGSATVDGGAGCLQSLGWEMLDRAGKPLPAPIVGHQLEAIAGLRAPSEAWPTPVRVLCDVDNPLLGPAGAAAVYGPQKGATREGVSRLERGLGHWAAVLGRHTGTRSADLPGAGAAGGLPAGLAAAIGARLCAGFDEVARLVKLRDLFRGCDLCLTGEGRLDEQTRRGKVVAGVARLGREAGVPVVALVGAAEIGPRVTLAQLAERHGLAGIRVISPDEVSLTEALAQTADNLRRAAFELLSGR